MKNRQYQPTQIGQKELEYKNDYHKIYRTKVYFENFTKEYYVNDHGIRAAVILTKDDSVLLVRQYRFLINNLSYELPGGGVKEKESPEQTAIRECLAETGMLPSKLISLFNYHLTLDCVKNYTHLYYSTDFEIKKIHKPNPKEIVDQKWIRIDECLDMISKGDIVDSMTIMGLLYYFNYII